MRASASEATSPGSKSRPVVPSSTQLRLAAIELTTGKSPQAMASSRDELVPSLVEAET